MDRLGGVDGIGCRSGDGRSRAGGSWVAADSAREGGCKRQDGRGTGW